MNLTELLDHGWWYLGQVSRVSTMADGSPRIQIDSTEGMIDTDGFMNFAKAQKNRHGLVMLVVPINSEFAKDLIEKLKVAEYGRKNE